MSRSPIERHSRTQCINGHDIHIPTIAGTPERVHQIRCPTCGRLTEVSSGELAPEGIDPERDVADGL
jgi:hypothetical protein